MKVMSPSAFAELLAHDLAGLLDGMEVVAGGEVLRHMAVDVLVDLDLDPAARLAGFGRVPDGCRDGRRRRLVAGLRLGRAVHQLAAERVLSGSGRLAGQELADTPALQQVAVELGDASVRLLLPGLPQPRRLRDVAQVLLVLIQAHGRRHEVREIASEKSSTLPPPVPRIDSSLSLVVLSRSATARPDLTREQFRSDPTWHASSLRRLRK